MPITWSWGKITILFKLSHKLTDIHICHNVILFAIKGEKSKGRFRSYTYTKAICSICYDQNWVQTGAAVFDFRKFGGEEDYTIYIHFNYRLDVSSLELKVYTSADFPAGFVPTH